MTCENLKPDACLRITSDALVEEWDIRPGDGLNLISRLPKEICPGTLVFVHAGRHAVKLVKWNRRRSARNAIAILHSITRPVPRGEPSEN